MKEIRIDAALENMDTLLGFIDEELETKDCPMKAKMQIGVAVEEVFTNIVNYAYDGVVGDAVVSVSVDAGVAAITFADKGKPYDPLAKEDPDVTLSAEERQIGGLGIFLVKKLMDEVLYKYEDGINILEIRKML